MGVMAEGEMCIGPGVSGNSNLCRKSGGFSALTFSQQLPFYLNNYCFHITYTIGDHKSNIVN